MKTIVQKIQFKASARELYAIFLDAKKHSLATGGKANIRGKVGATFSVWDGYIKGRNLLLVPNRLIVQRWRTTEFSKSDADSILILTFEEKAGGCVLTLTHAALPDQAAAPLGKGWHQFYWKPIKAYLESRRA